MSEQVQEINPLDISFSNDKGFEPSTPSQCSPPSEKPKENKKMHIKTPIQLWEKDRMHYSSRNRVSSFKIDTPPSRQINLITQSLKKHRQSPRYSDLKKYQARYSSSYKNKLTDSLIFQDRFPSTLPNYSSLASYRETPREQKKLQLEKWNKIDTSSHLKDITRLNDLINRVSTHVSFYGRLYPTKKK